MTPTERIDALVEARDAMADNPHEQSLEQHAASFRLAQQQAIGFLAALMEHAAPEDIEHHNTAANHLLIDNMDFEGRMRAAAQKLGESRDALEVFLRLALSLELFEKMDPDDFAKQHFSILTCELRVDELAALQRKKRN